MTDISIDPASAGVSAGNTILEFLIKANTLRLSKKVVLRALYTELSLNIEILKVIDTEQLKDTAVDDPVFKNILNALETGTVYSILYSTKELDRSVYRQLEKKISVKNDETDTAENKTLLEALIFINRRLAVLKKLSSLSPDFFKQTLRLKVRLKNIYTSMTEAQKGLRELDEKLHFLAPKKK